MNAFIGRLAACFTLTGAAALAPAYSASLPLAELDVADDQQRRDFKAETDLYCIALRSISRKDQQSRRWKASAIARVDRTGESRHAKMAAATSAMSFSTSAPAFASSRCRLAACAQEHRAAEPLGNRDGRRERRTRGRNEVGEQRHPLPHLNPAIIGSQRMPLQEGVRPGVRKPAGMNSSASRRKQSAGRSLSSDPAECQRYKAALELKKKIAKAAAENGARPSGENWRSSRASGPSTRADSAIRTPRELASRQFTVEPGTVRHAPSVERMLAPNRLSEQLVIKEHDFINPGNGLAGTRV